MTLFLEMSHYLSLAGRAGGFTGARGVLTSLFYPWHQLNLQPRTMGSSSPEMQKYSPFSAEPRCGWLH